MSLHITVKGKEYEMPRQFAKLSKYLTSRSSENIEINNISNDSFEKCLDFCEYYMGIDTDDQMALEKDTIGFMADDKYSHYTERFDEMFGDTNELLFDTMNTAELLDIEPLTCVLSYYLYQIVRLKKITI